MLQARHLEGRSEVKSWRKMKSLLRSQFLTSDYKLLSDVVKPSGVTKVIEKQGIDADAKGMDINVQLRPVERDAEVKSHNRKLLEVDKPVAVSTEVFELIATSSQVMDSGDGSDGDQKRGADVYVESMPIDTELNHGKSVAKVEFHGEKFFEIDKDDERSTELPTLSTEGWFLSCEAKSEPINFVDGCGDDQRLETDVDAESIVRTNEGYVVMSIASGAPEDARLEGQIRKGRQVYLGDYNMAEKAASTVDEIEQNLVAGSAIRWEDLVLGKEIGEGTFDIVYHGIWMGSDVAIKVYTRMDYRESILLYYKKEVAIMKKLRHPNLLLFLGAVYSPESLAIVTDADVDCPRTQGWQITFPPKPGWLKVYFFFFLVMRLSLLSSATL